MKSPTINGNNPYKKSVSQPEKSFTHIGWMEIPEPKKPQVQRVLVYRAYEVIVRMFYSRFPLLSRRIIPYASLIFERKIKLLVLSLSLSLLLSLSLSLSLFSFLALEFICFASRLSQEQH